MKLNFNFRFFNLNKLVKYNINNRIAYITLDRPEKKNALNAEFISLLTKSFENAATDNHIKIVVLKANGTVFSAGADLAHMQKLQSNSFDENIEDSSLLRKLYETIYTHPKLVIAQVEGHAIAGGCGLATVCDLIFSTPEAMFGYTEVKIGFVPALVTIFLLRKIGEAKTRELVLTGQLISAETAKQIGLINFISQSQTIEKEVITFAEKISETTSAQSIALTKNLINNLQDTSSLEDSLKYASEVNANSRLTDDFKMGIGGFLNHNKIVW